MSEGLKELPVPFYLPLERKMESRELYEQVFYEDTEKFVDYIIPAKFRTMRFWRLKKKDRSYPCCI